MLYPLSYEGWLAGLGAGGLLGSHVVVQEPRSQRRSC